MWDVACPRLLGPTHRMWGLEGASEHTHRPL